MSALVATADRAIVAECREAIARGSRSFALASRLLPRTAADDAALVYAWCRRADDAVDVPAAEGSAAAVARLRAELDLVYSGAPLAELDRRGGAALAGFAAVARAREIPRAYPDALLDGMEADAAGPRLATWDELLAYAWQVAGSVGVMMCHVLGLSDAGARRHAAHLGIAMQLTNICRDVLEDWERGRRYLPAELLVAHGGAAIAAVPPGEPLPDEARAVLAAAVRDVLDVADGFYRSGERGLPALPWRAALGVRAARLVYGRIGAVIAARDHDVLAGRAVVPRARKLALAARAIASSAIRAPARLLRRFRAVPLGAPLRFPDDVLPR